MLIVYGRKLIKYCKLNPKIDSDSKPSQLVRIISEYYNLDKQLIYLNNLENKEENLDVRTSRKILVQIFFNLLVFHTDEWVKDNLDKLYVISTCKEDSLKEIYATAQIYPNQLNKLCSNTNLKRDIDLTEEVIVLYNKVLKTEIQSHIVYKKFNEFIAEDQYINNKYLTTQIEEAFFESDIHNINIHPFKDDILNIISKLRNPFYTDLFPRLDDKKANLMLDVVTNENTKDDIFSIVTLQEEQLKKLGILVKENNFESLLNKAAEVLQQEDTKRADFRHKYEIGTNIERLIREEISDKLQERLKFINKKELKTEDEQGGQDIIITLDGKPFYYIEVKSRWKSDHSVSMSKLQLQRASEENSRYALCCVDISKYQGSNDKYELGIEEILPLTKILKNIGCQIEPLINENLKAEQNPDEAIHLIDYRGIIPQDIIREGESFSDLINSLFLKINSI